MAEPYSARLRRLRQYLVARIEPGSIGAADALRIVDDTIAFFDQVEAESDRLHRAHSGEVENVVTLARFRRRAGFRRPGPGTGPEAA